MIASFLALLVATPADPPPEQRWTAIVAEASARFAVPPQWIARVIHAESGGRTTLTGRPIRSPAGAMGLMQLMPATWAELRATYRLGNDPDDPHDNIVAGTAYLAAMRRRFGYPGLFAAYNVGPARYADHLARGTPLPAETQAYLGAVTEETLGTHPVPAAQPRSRLFVVMDGAANAAEPPPPAPLFAIERGGR